MGSSIFKDYDVTKENAASGGPGKLWKIHSATNKLTSAKCSVWAVEKKSVEHLQKLDEIWSLLQRDFTVLAKLRFPLIVNVSRPVENVKSAIFAETEPVTWSLSALLESKTHLDELEIKMGLIQLCEALNFIHSTAQLVHLNLCPSSIMICQPDWKLSGFAFSVAQSSADGAKAHFDPTPTTSFGSDRSRATLSNPIDLTKPALDYTAPEVVFLNQITPAADMFSLGCLIFELFGLTTDSRIPRRLLSSSGSVDTYRRNIEELVPLSMEHIPAGLKRFLEALLATNPAQRPTAEDLLKSEYFNDTAVKTLQYLSHMNEHDDRSKADFLKGLKVALGALTISNKILTTKILPPLIAELRNTILIPLLLPNIFLVAEMLEQNLNGAIPSRSGAFANVIFPALIPISHIPEPFHIMVILLQKLEFMSKRISEESLTKHLMPIACGALDHPNGAVVVLALKEMLPLLPHFDHETIRTTLTPRVLNLIHSSKTPQVMRVQALFTMSKLIPFAARNFIEGSILPSVLHTISIDRSPTTLTSVAGVCDVISHKFGIEFTAVRILPALTPLLIDAGLNRKQFDTLLSILNGMTGRIVDSRRKAIEEAESRNQNESTSIVSDAERLQAFSATLPPVSATIINTSTPPPISSSILASNSGIKLPEAVPLDRNSGSIVSSSSGSSIASAKGAAAFNAVLNSQAQRRQAVQDMKDKTTLIDTEQPLAEFGSLTNSSKPQASTVPTSSLFSIPLQASSSSSALPSSSSSSLLGVVVPSSVSGVSLSSSGSRPASSPFSLSNADLFSLDVSAFNLDSNMTPAPASLASNGGGHDPLAASSSSTPGMLFPSAAFISPPSLSPTPTTDDDDDFFDPRAFSQRKPTQSIFESGNSSSGFLQASNADQPLLPAVIAVPQAGSASNTSNEFFF